MGRRTDTRDRIIQASMRGMRERGFGATAISDIVTASGAPRGSVTFHFPGGKDEIAREVVTLRTTQLLERLDATAAESDSAAGFMTACVDAIAAEFADSQFTAGCPVVPVCIERSAQSDQLRLASMAFFKAWRGAVAHHLAAHGVDGPRAERVATLAVSAIEGALVICRSERTVDALVAVREELRLLIG
ncbi:TetR/AcrR family transcriptional repressor of lmrAB and yxaGH operons [Streptomyces sp. SAI-117]|uniref:TetR/AcrR family transcriptional regulator n=1 Tax=Streptomyces sp. SAI-117 TaxID=2940546 RepID=UPI002475BB4B|nr:TetR/AcrR family transcriptional regulator [Streptomyces sp. SAI-117]MDH6573654.1 TetR/AcrR family transcriptional repressor of lmrAB and yxaGH operons [Streptomyces sp. SAI-117]